MNLLKNKLSVLLLLAAFLVQTEAVFLFLPNIAKSQTTNLPITAITETNHSGTSSDFVYDQEDVGSQKFDYEINIIEPFPNARISEIIMLEVMTSGEVELVYFELVGPENRRFLAQHDNPHHFFYEFDTRTFPNGSYYLIAEAHWQERQKRTQQHFYINNEVIEENEELLIGNSEQATSTEAEIATTSDQSVAEPEEQGEQEEGQEENELFDTSIATSSTEQEMASSSTEALETNKENWRIKIDESPEFVSGPILIKARSNFVPDSVEFVVTSQSVQRLPARKISSQVFSFLLLIDEDLHSEDYIISAVAKQEENEYSDTINISYIKERFEPEEVEESDPLHIEFINPPAQVSGEAKIIVSSNYSLDKIDFFVQGKAQRKFVSQSEIENTYYFIWPTKDFPDGDYELSAGAIEFGVLQKTITTNIIVKNNFQDQNNETEKDDIFDKIDEVEITAKAEEQAEAPKKSEINIECKKFGFLDKKKCDDFLKLPSSCREKGLHTETECREFMAMDEVCREREYTVLQCKKYLALPKLCQKAEEFSDEKCQEIIKLDSLPEKCKAQNINTHVECEKFLLQTEIPGECTKLGVSSVEECRLLMTKTNQPVVREELAKICRDNNIQSKEKCESFLQERNQEEECRALELQGGKECNDFLFDKYGLDFCSRVKIGNKEECRAYLFNHYKDILTCEERDYWACQNEFRANYLGKIIEKQSKFEAVKKELAKKEVVKIKTIKSRLGENDLIPLRNEELFLKIQKADEAILVNEDDEVIQTSPAVLVIDSDQDGLPDSTEERIGTDPNKKDSDGDGYDDKSEIENGYNPLGEGKVVKEMLSLIDKAIINDQAIEHPKVSGEVNKKFQVTTIQTIENELQEVEAYKLSGTAEPNQVVTLYFYSDLPVVTTVSTDGNGNWQYEFKNILTEGDHEVYVVVNDNTGRVVKKSNPLNFFVKEARAVSVHDYFAAAVISNPDEPAGMINYYLIFALLLITSSISLFVIYLVYYRKKQVA